MGECAVCCDVFNKSNRSQIDCPACEFSACRMCVQKYLLETTNDPHCMSCRNVWSREFIDATCTQKFRMKELKEHREVVLFEREKCLMPQTQPLVEHRILMRRLRNEEIRLTEEVADAERTLSDHRRLMVQMMNTNLSVTKERREFVRKCPVEDCKGFLSTSWKCGICEKRICPDCNEIKLEDHECDANSVETVKLLKKDTKPCPKCGTMIFKISGCSQMWCVDCHTTFNWNTMRIEQGVIHNPHFYEAQRRGIQIGRAHGDIPCGGLPNIYELNNIFGGMRADYSFLTHVHNCITHIQYWEMRGEPPENVDNVDRRVTYMMNEITEEVFKKDLQKREKAHCKYRDTYHLNQLLVDTLSDEMRRCVIDTAVDRDKFEQMRLYYNDMIVVINKRYGSRAHKGITKDTWVYV